jgi:hypothetical protein
MAEPVALKYGAFISYSHIDTASAQWLHRGLEGFRIDKDLVGRKPEIGTVPRSLRPIFRDRDDFTAGHSLTEQTLEALDGSEALVAICSPSVAKSHYVTEEIRLFKSRHPDRPVIPLIVDGSRTIPRSNALRLPYDSSSMRKAASPRKRSSFSLPMRAKKAMGRILRWPKLLRAFSV